MIYFQIGTFNGKDLFREKVIKDNPDLVILVEPNLEMIDEIKKNYVDIKNVKIYNNAIYYNNDEIVELVIPSKNGILGKRAENGIIYAKSHFSLIPMNDWGEKKDMITMNAKSITFNKICEINNITNIEYLQIDTEGFDSEIIKMIDFNKYKINQLRFEKWNFNNDCFTKYHNNKSEIYGTNGTNFVMEKLKLFNYKCKNINDKDGNDIIATLNNKTFL
jgi:FkbM family methyltransferase